VPRMKRLTRYPVTYINLIEAAYRRPVRITLDTESTAVSLRADIYLFRKAIEQQVKKSPTRKLTALWSKARYVQLRVVGNVLIAEPRKDKTRAVSKALAGSDKTTA